MADSSDIKIIILIARDSEPWPFLSKPNRRETIRRSCNDAQLEHNRKSRENPEDYLRKSGTQELLQALLPAFMLSLERRHFVACHSSLFFSDRSFAPAFPDIELPAP